MPVLLAGHRVKDYGRWKAAFDEHGEKRRELSSSGGRILRNAEKPGEILILNPCSNSAENIPELASLQDGESEGDGAGSRVGGQT